MTPTTTSAAPPAKGGSAPSEPGLPAFAGGGFGALKQTRQARREAAAEHRRREIIAMIETAELAIQDRPVPVPRPKRVEQGLPTVSVEETVAGLALSSSPITADLTFDDVVSGAGAWLDRRTTAIDAVTAAPLELAPYEQQDFDDPGDHVVPMGRNRPRSALDSASMSLAGVDLTPPKERSRAAVIVGTLMVITLGLAISAIVWAGLTWSTQGLTLVPEWFPEWLDPKNWSEAPTGG